MMAQLDAQIVKLFRIIEGIYKNIKAPLSRLESDYHPAETCA